MRKHIAWLAKRIRRDGHPGGVTLNTTKNEPRKCPENAVRATYPRAAARGAVVKRRACASQKAENISSMIFPCQFRGLECCKGRDPAWLHSKDATPFFFFSVRSARKRHLLPTACSLSFFLQDFPLPVIPFHSPLLRTHPSSPCASIPPCSTEDHPHCTPQSQGYKLQAKLGQALVVSPWPFLGFVGLSANVANVACKSEASLEFGFETARRIACLLSNNN